METHQQTQNELLPSGYASVEQLPEKIEVGNDILPWADGTQELSVARCMLQSGQEFYLASAVGVNQKLVKAAMALNEHQQNNVNNMLYSRLPDFMENFYSSSVETMRTGNDFPVYVMRNKAGQRVYFSTPEVQINDTSTRLALRLAVCDKNKQYEVVKTLDPDTSKQKLGKARKA